jgi:hypothetical protein
MGEIYMSTEKNNYEALKKMYPEIYKRLMNHKPNNRYKFVKTPANPNTPNILDTQTNKLFYDKVNPIAAATADMKSRNIKVPNVNVFLGAGLFYNISAFFDIHKDVTGAHFIIERDMDLFAQVLKIVDISSVINNSQFYFFIAEEPKIIFANINQILINTNAKGFAKSVNFIEDAGCFSTDKEYYLNCVRAARDAIRETVVHFGNDPHDSLIGIHNTFMNIKEILNYPGIKDLKDKFKGKPGIVVASGPSLNKNIHLLKGLEEKAVICAADGSVKIMKEKGMKPHMVTSLERMTPTSKLFEGLTEEDVKDVYLSATPVIHPQTYENFPGERIIVYRDFATFKWLNIEKGILKVGPSAGNMAFNLLNHMGCDPIILIGQDLAFGPGDKTHASGYEYGEIHESDNNKNVREVEGNYEPKIKTTRVWEMFLNYYHREVMASDATVINATEGGAKILGTKIMTFEEAISQFIKDDINPLDIIRENLEYPNEELINQQTEATKELVSEGLTFCRNSKKEFIEGYKLCQEYNETVWKEYEETKVYNRESAKELFERLDKVAKVFVSKDFYNILMHFVQSYYIRCLIEFNHIKATAKTLEEENFKIIQYNKDMYAVMVGLVDKMIEMLEHLEKELYDIRPE